MPRYRVKEISFINNTLCQAGEEVDYAGDPGANLEALDKGASAAVKAAAQVAPAVADLIAKVRQHAATRGVTPDEVNQSDFDEVLNVLPNKPSEAVVAAALTLTMPAASVS